MYVWSKRLEFWLIAIAVLALGASCVFAWWSTNAERLPQPTSLPTEAAYAGYRAGDRIPRPHSPQEEPRDMQHDNPRWQDQTRERQVFLAAGTIIFLGMVALTGVFLRRLRMSEERFRKLLDAVGSAILIVHEQTIVETNGYVAEMFAPPKTMTVTGMDTAIFCGLFLPAGGVTAREIRHRLSQTDSEEKFCVDTRLRRADGSYFDAELCIAPLDHHGERLLLLVVRDISERKANEAAIYALNAGLEMRVAERTAQLTALNGELESFSTSISHDLRAPLHRISGFSAILLTGDEMRGEESHRQLSIINREATRMAEMIDDLLALAKLDRAPLRKSTVNLAELVAAARDNVIGISEDAAERDIRWTVDPLPDVAADRRLLLQVFINLLSNAVKYTRGIAIANIHIGLVMKNAENNEVVIFVRDNGVGFDMQRAKKLFGVFERLHSAQAFEGTGVGLANVRRIVNRHGGRVWAEAKPNAGATFFIGLPGAR